MTTVGNILQTKGHDVFSVSPDASVFDALRMMAEKNVGALLVIDQGSIVGIFSERDYARKVILSGRTSRETLVREIMTPDVITVRTTQSINECMTLMTGGHIRHLPVLEGDRVVGVISIGDVVKAVISDQQETIQQLERYICGGM